MSLSKEQLQRFNAVNQRLAIDTAAPSTFPLGVKNGRSILSEDPSKSSGPPEDDHRQCH